MFDAYELNEGGVDARIRKILQHIIMEPYHTKADFLNAMVGYLDSEDEMDTFGTEGWEHRFNI